MFRQESAVTRDGTPKFWITTVLLTLFTFWDSPHLPPVASLFGRETSFQSQVQLNSLSEMYRIRSVFWIRYYFYFFSSLRSRVREFNANLVLLDLIFFLLIICYILQKYTTIVISRKVTSLEVWQTISQTTL